MHDEGRWAYQGWRVVLAAFFGVLAGFGTLVFYTFGLFRSQESSNKIGFRDARRRPLGLSRVASCVGRILWCFGRLWNSCLLYVRPVQIGRVFEQNRLSRCTTKAVGPIKGGELCWPHSLVFWPALELLSSIRSACSDRKSLRTK